jgi:hypothetical protein
MIVEVAGDGLDEAVSKQVVRSDQYDSRTLPA